MAKPEYCPKCCRMHDILLMECPPKKLEVNLGICKICELVMAYVRGRGCSGCGSETEPLKAALKSDGTILFYTEGP